MPCFGPVAKYYDKLMNGIPYLSWTQYYLTLLKQQKKQPKTMLDICCGTGSMVHILTKKGYEVEGVDISKQMIEEARNKAHNNKLSIKYHQADVTQFNLNKKFDAAYSFFDSLNYIIYPDKLQNAFKNIAKHLKPNGSFIFDMNTAFAYETDMFDQIDLRESAELKYKWVGDYDSDSKTIQVEMNFWHEGKHFTEEHIQRAYSLEEIIEYLTNAGFTSITAYDSYTLNEPHSKSDRIHFCCILK